jgi:hypothetical protein
MGIGKRTKVLKGEVIMKYITFEFDEKHSFDEIEKWVREIENTNLYKNATEIMPKKEK